MLTALLIPTGPSLEPTASGPPKNYTIQVLSMPAENALSVLASYETFRKKGYLVYRCRGRVDGRWYVRLRTGVFRSRSEAHAYGAQFKSKEGLDYFVTEADGFVDRRGNDLLLFTTPSGIWLQSGDSARQLYRPTNGEIDTACTRARLAPDGRAIAFYDHQRIVAVPLDTGEVQILRQAHREDEILNSVVRWSPDGQYLAYLDAVEWELPTRLWLIARNGTNERCLVADRTGRTRVKSFLWHRRENRIFYVAGPTHGTVSVGGTLYSIDLGGHRRVLARGALEEGTEVHSTFHITADVLHYRIAHFDATGLIRKYTQHSLALTEPK